MNQNVNRNRKIAAHRIVLPDGKELRDEVVELDAKGQLLAHHPLQGEEPFVEWFSEFDCQQKN